MREAKIQVKGGTIIEELYVSIVNAVERHLGDCPDVLCDDLWGIIQHDCQDEDDARIADAWVKRELARGTEDDGA